jgi:FtsX-like permease family
VIEVLHVAWYRTRTGRRQRTAGYLGVALLIGLVGGVAMASVAGARRTESSFPSYVASTNPSTVGIFTMYDDPGLGLTTGYVASLAARVSHLGLVTRAADAIIFDGNIDLSSVKGIHPVPVAGEAPPTILGSTDGEFTSMDRVTVMAGRLPRPSETGAAVVNAEAVRQLGIHVGSVLRVPFYSDQQVASPLNTPPRWVTITIVGEVEASRDVIESDFEALNSALVIFSPALTKELESRYATGTETFLQTQDGDRSAKRVLAEVAAIDPIAGHFPAEITTSFVPAAQQAITPEAVALGVFGGIAGLSALLIAGLMIGRDVRARGDDLDALRALGADRPMLLADEVVGLLGALVVGALLAVGVAVSLSPLAPLGPVRPVYPTRGVAFDWTVLGAGFLILVAVLGSVTVLAMLREIRRHTAAHRAVPPARRQARLLRGTAALGIPVSIETGLRFATETGRGRNAAPVRFAMLGAMLAVTVLVSSLTFGGSLNNLVSHPALYGWNWNFALLSSFAGAEDLPGPQVAALLNDDHNIKAWSGVNFAAAKLDGQRVQVMTEKPGSIVAPPLLTGHALNASNQILLGPTTLALLHKHVGDTVTLTNGVSKPTRLVVVGTVTMPALSQNDGEGTGAVAATSDFPPALLNLQDATVPGPSAILVRLRSGVTAATGLQSLKNINTDVNKLAVSSGLGGGVIGSLRPVEIVNFRSMGAAPAILAASLTLGAILALGLTLSASVRGRRRDLALLKTMGFSRRQLFASIAWQATSAATVGIVVGIPLGVVIGRQLWMAFARSIAVVPNAIVSASTLVEVAVGAIVFANIVAVFPGRTAARTSTAIVLRSE